MAKISTYIIDSTPSLTDKLIGSDAQDASSTKNYLISDVIGLTPTPTLQEVLVAGNGTTVDINLSGAVNMPNLPTSATGLAPGDLWRNGTVINIV